MGKKRIYIKVLAIVAAVFVIGVIITKTVDKRRQMYREQISEILDANWNYQHDLSIEGTLDLFSFDFDLDGIDWRSMPVDRYLMREFWRFGYLCRNMRLITRVSIRC